MNLEEDPSASDQISDYYLAGRELHEETYHEWFKFLVTQTQYSILLIQILFDKFRKFFRLESNFNVKSMTTADFHTENIAFQNALFKLRAQEHLNPKLSLATQILKLVPLKKKISNRDLVYI